MENFVGCMEIKPVLIVPVFIERFCLTDLKMKMVRLKELTVLHIFFILLMYFILHSRIECVALKILNVRLKSNTL